MGMKPYLSSAFIVLSASGCNLLSGKCTYELRSFDGAGHALANGTEVATAHVNLSEQRGSIVRQSFTWSVSGSLKGHVNSASFKDSSDPTHVLLDLPILSADRTPIAEGAADTREGATLGGFHNVLVAEHGVIELQTDQTATPTVTIPISTTNASDWVRPYCS